MLERLVSTIGEGLVALDPHLRYGFLNDAAERLLGLSRQEALGRTLREVLPEPLLGQLLPHVQAALATGQPVTCETHMPHPERWVEHRLRPWDGGVTILSLDVTERRRADDGLRRREAMQALRESRDVLALAMRGGRMGAWSRNLSTNVVWWSRELEELFGLPPGGFEGTEAGFFAFVHPEDRPHVEAAVAEAIRTDTDYVVEFRFRHGEGRWRWMDGRGRAVYEKDGTPLWLYGLGIDITERKEAEAALDAARAAADADAERLHLAMAVARLGDWSWDTRTDLITYSARAAEIFGVDPTCAMTWAEVRERIHPDDRDRARLAVEVAVETHGDYAMEYRIMRHGRERWISARGRPRYDATGAPIGMQGVVQDVSHDRLLVHLDDAVRGLTAAEDITSTAARMLGEHLGADRCAYATVDGDGALAVTGNYVHGIHSLVGRHRLSSVGAHVARLLETGAVVTVDDTQTDGRLTPEESDTYASAAIRAFIAAPILKAGRLEAGMAVHCAQPRAWHSHEVALVQQVASRCWESIQRARVEEERAALLARERLARLEAEQQNRRLAQLSEAAEAANRAKDEFMAMLGHELRNPLAPILTGLQLMRLRGDTGSDRERIVIERQVRHLTRLVDDLLDVSRITRGQVELKLAPVETAEVVARAIEIASPLLEARTHTLTVDVPRAGLPILVDPARLSQVVANLLTNAARYTPHGGAITVTAGRDGDFVEVRVRDTGIGIAPEMLPTVFDLFVQGRQASNRAEGGLGLGLAIVRNLVERHGGRVEAHSDGIGCGSEFAVWVPRAPILARHEQPLRSRPPEAPRVPLPHAQRVLIVDDNEDAADMLAHVLASRGHQTRVAHDGVEALRACEEFRPQTALLDLGLPVMDGYELASRLRALPGLEDIRLIAITGYGQESDRRRTSAAGFQHHLVKPVDISLIEGLLT
jgi:PAS domain S-box-containing protein